MRGWNNSIDDFYLAANLTSAETNFRTAISGDDLGEPTATGFKLRTTSGAVNASGEQYIYIAIRRGPMKVPTSGTSVFLPYTAAAASGGVNITTNFVADATFSHENRAGTGSATYVTDRLRGSSTSKLATLITSATSAESAAAISGFYDYAYNTSLYDKYAANNNWAGGNFVDWIFKRAPSFMDVVCYTGDGTDNRAITQTLTTAPELIIVKSRSNTNGWAVWCKINSSFGLFSLNDTAVYDTSGTSYNGFPSTSSASTFTVRSGSNAWGSGSFSCNVSSTNYVAYLFATCAGVSKVFSYTGNGSSQTINCGFIGGARFVLIKRTDSTGDWYVWDSARGIVSGNDPHLSLNTTAAEVTTDDTIDTDSTGFVVNQVSATNVNVSSATYIGIAIA
jgi:hypothetical protein